MTYGKTKKTMRALFFSAALLFWVIVLVEALELFAAGWLYWIEHHNPLIRATSSGSLQRVNGQSLPPVTLRLPSAPLSWDQFSAAAMPASATPLQELSDAAGKNAEGWRRDFPGLPEEQRDTAAIIRGDAVIVFGEDGGIAKVYGDGLAKCLVRNSEIDSLRQAAVRALHDKQTGYERIPLAGENTSVFFLTPNQPGACALFAFVPANAAPPKQDLPADSPWELPFFQYKKNLSGVKTRGWELSTNEQGFRNRNVAVPKPAGTFRILCIGGSTTEEGPSLDRTYPAFLEQQLKGAFPGKNIEVVNAGVSGMTTRKHLARLADYFALEPDLMILYEGVNDAALDLPIEWHLFELSAWRRLASHSSFLRCFVNGLFSPNRIRMEGAVQELPVANLQAIAAAAMKRGIRTAVCSVAAPDPDLLTPSEWQFYDYDARTHWKDPLLSFRLYVNTVHAFNSALPDLCKANGLFYIPVAEHMRGGSELFVDICHMTDDAIQRKAEVVFAAVLEYIRPALARLQP